jgi:hypothetical protein
MHPEVIELRFRAKHEPVAVSVNAVRSQLRTKMIQAHLSPRGYGSIANGVSIFLVALFVAILLS